MSDFVDIGHGVSIQLMHINGALHGIEYRHPTPDGKVCNGYVPVKAFCSSGWDVLSEKPLTLSPSLLCRVCGHHGFIRNGAWVPA